MNTTTCCTCYKPLGMAWMYLCYGTKEEFFLLHNDKDCHREFLRKVCPSPTPCVSCDKPSKCNIFNCSDCPYCIHTVGIADDGIHHHYYQVTCSHACSSVARKKQQTIFGISPPNHCKLCGAKEPSGQVFNRCGRCHTVSYCSRTCQVRDWRSHKELCVERKDV